MFKRYFFLLILHLVLLASLNFTAWPEMFSYPYLFSHGFTLYKDFIHPYPLLLTTILAGVFGVFGYSVMVLKIFTWILILSSDLVLILILELLIREYPLKLILFTGFIFIQSFLGGNMLWFDSALILPLLLGFLKLIKWFNNHEDRDLFLSAIFLTLSTEIKQTAILYLLILAGLIIFRKKTTLKRLAIFLGGVLIIKVPVFIYLTIGGSLRDFFLWIFYYPTFVWSRFPGYVDFSLTRKEEFTLLLLLVPLSFILGLKKVSTKLAICLVFLFFSAISVYPRFSFFHLQPFIFFLIITLGLIWNNSSQKIRNIELGVFLVATISIVVLYRQEIGNKTRFLDNEQTQVSQLIDKYTKEDERVFLLGLNSSEYTLSNRLPPKYWADNFVWYFEIPGVQERTLEGFRENQPKLILRKLPEQGNQYDLGVYQPKKIVDYIYSYYNKLDTVNLVQIWIKK